MNALQEVKIKEALAIISSFGIIQGIIIITALVSLHKPFLALFIIGFIILFIVTLSFGLK